MGVANLPTVLILIVSQGDSSGGQGPSGAVCKPQKTFGASIVNICILCARMHTSCAIYSNLMYNM